MKDPLKFNWRPKVLLPQLANIYLHLEQADSKGAFASAIAASDRYWQDMFPETCQVLHIMPWLVICHYFALYIAKWNRQIVSWIVLF